MKFHQTKFPELQYAEVEKGCWSYFNEEHRVGPLYPTKESMLLDLDRYAWESWGLGDGPASPWQPIETAPKDCYILGYDPHLKRPFVMIWNIHDNCFAVCGSIFDDETPTHWMSIPECTKGGN